VKKVTMKNHTHLKFIPQIPLINENSHQPAKTIEEIEDEIEQAEKDSVAEDIIDAAEAIQLIR